VAFTSPALGALRLRVARIQSSATVVFRMKAAAKDKQRERCDLRVGGGGPYAYEREEADRHSQRHSHVSSRLHKRSLTTVL
jgi:hypothetical protein